MSPARQMFNMAWRMVLFLVFVALIGISEAAPCTRSLVATVDMGYTIQEGILEANQDASYFNFTNVRYAAPPTGRNRFKPPLHPATNRTTQKAGSFGIMCPQAQPGWINYAGSDVGNLTELPPFSIDDLSAPDPGSSEDCLFLDILIPENVFNNRKISAAPVLLFIHGGGYVEGSKTTYGSGVGLLDAAETNGQNVIYVSINYRLGLFGFLLGANTSEVSPNLGLQDQVFALQWVKDYIHLFGGDKDAVTIIGESAGAGSIMYHLTSPNVSSQALFQRGIAQSPYTYYISQSQQEETFQQILKTSNASSFSDLQEMPSETLQICNGLVVGNARPYGTFVFGPIIDGSNYPEYPPILLAQGQYDPSIQIMHGHNADEGALFASPFIHDDSEFDSEISMLFPQASTSALSNITQTMYPSDFSGKYGYVDQLGRIAQVLADATITCNNYLLDKVFESLNASFAYEFSVPPAWHSDDLSYTFMNPEDPETGVNTTLAVIMQRYFVNFAETGSPNSITKAWLTEFASAEGLVVQNLNSTMFGPMLDTDINAQRCDWWQRGLFM